MSALAALAVLALQLRGDPHARAGFELAPSGALLRAPAEGLSAIDGPALVLGAGWSEAYGLAWRDSRGVHEAVGVGARPDWAARTPVEAQPLRSAPGWSLARAQAGPLAIETRAERRGARLFLAVALTNLGPEPLRELVYSREWLVPGAEGWTFPPDLAVRADAPAELARRLWMLDDLAPGASGGLVLSFRVGEAVAVRGPVEVPLALYVDERWPEGVRLGRTNGVSFGDYDADGWPDLFSLESARLLRNAEGVTWDPVADLTDLMPPSTNRYGSSFGDYDNDGLPDIGTEPRPAGDSCMHLLHNLGGAVFDDIADDPLLLEGQPCNAPSETIGWADVEEDGDLDLFLPVYGGSLGPGNSFLENLGPTGPGGAYRLRETSAEAGLDNPPQTARPEGAQFLDVDGDGDMDLYSNGTLYQNQSEEHPRFVAMTENGAGIGLRQSLDEGAAFFDYDLDGDQDLFIVYTQRGVRVWESRGDGTFFAATGLVDEPFTGLDLGLSAEDWDMDGDVDFTTRQVFRRNRFVEDGERHFTVATHAIPSTHLTSATPAWGDWDKDGDLDCALGNWQSVGHFYQNTLWDAALPAEQKPYLRVRVAHDDPAVPRGLETEYGATVELVLHGDPHRRQKFVASGHGYLNQNEYALCFALPPGPDPAAPAAGLVCDVVVDFPSRASRGVLRVDRAVNPALGAIGVVSLAERELTVFRSGRVLLDGVEHAPRTDFGARLFATGGGLALADPELGLPKPELNAGHGRWVGIELTTPRARRVQVKELVLDAQLAPAAPFNLALWDVTDPEHPQRVLAAARETSSRNRRTSLPFEATLEPARVYRCVAAVVEQRILPVSGPHARRGLELKGGLAFLDLYPESGKEVARAELEPGVALALRYVDEGNTRLR
jgi:VCBS repeat protein